MRTNPFCFESLECIRDRESAAIRRNSFRLFLALLALNIALAPFGYHAAVGLWMVFHPQVSKGRN